MKLKRVNFLSNSLSKIDIVEVVGASLTLSQDGKHSYTWSDCCGLWFANYIALRLENKSVDVQLMCLKFCRIALGGLTYSDVFALLAAGGQAKCIIDSKLWHIVLVRVRLMFPKAMSKSLRKINLLG